MARPRSGSGSGRSPEIADGARTAPACGGRRERGRAACSAACPLSPGVSRCDVGHACAALICRRPRDAAQCHGPDGFGRHGFISAGCASSAGFAGVKPTCRRVCFSPEALGEDAFQGLPRRLEAPGRRLVAPPHLRGRRGWGAGRGGRASLRPSPVASGLPLALAPPSSTFRAPLIPSGRLVLRENCSVSRSVTLSHLRSALGPCEVTVTGSGFGWAHVGRRRQRGAQLVSLTLNPSRTIQGLGESTT